MPNIKEISKCRRIPKEKQSLESEDSIDDEDTELDDEYLKMRKLLRESQDKKFIRRLKKKLKENLLKHQDGDSTKSLSDSELPHVEYPQPLPKIDKNKINGGIEIDSSKKHGLRGQKSAKNKSLPKHLKRVENVRKTTSEKSKRNQNSSLNCESAQQVKNDSTRFDGKSEYDKQKDDKSKKGNKSKTYAYPFTDNDRDLTKNEVEAMIRMVLKQSREEGGNVDEIDDVSLGETESTPSEEEIDIGEIPELSSTPDDISGRISSDDDQNIVY